MSKPISPATVDVAAETAASGDKSSQSSRPNPPTPAPSTNVFAVHGVEPEVQAYAMAKYSRSSLSMKQSLRELNEQKAEEFLNTFYFQYGHRSIADLAHVAMAVERLSMLAAISLVDEQRWDGQERSTRYQNFKKSGYYTPDLGGDEKTAALYRSTAEMLFREYESLSEGVFRWLREKTPRPEEMKQDAYERTLRARAFDASRYLLPLATNTSLGQIVNARTLETQIGRLLAHTHAEVRQLAELLKRAAREPAYNVNHESYSALVEQIRAVDPELGHRAGAELLKQVRVSPTLVKYANASAYESQTRQEMQQAARELMAGAKIEAAEVVELLDAEPLETELACTLLYRECHYPYRQIKERVESLTAARVQELVDLGLRHRGKHDELLRAFSAGQRFRFDILMDIGGFRDMHRHRRCVQVEQDFTAAHGAETPQEFKDSGLAPHYHEVMAKAGDAVSEMSTSGVAEAAESAQYLLPLAFRKRTLFKMDFAEALYIAELRTTEAGHWSYRNVAYKMYEAVARKHPALARYFRVTDIAKPVDLLRR